MQSLESDRRKGGNEVGNPVHGMVGKHATHRETTEIDAVAVNLVLCHHFLDDSLDEVDIAIARSVPRLVDTVGEDHDELGRVAYSLHTHVLVLKLAVLHPVCILVVAVTEDEQRTVLPKVFRSIDIV